MINYFEQSVLQIITVLYLNLTYIQAKKKEKKQRTSLCIKPKQKSSIEVMF